MADGGDSLQFDRLIVALRKLVNFLIDGGSHALFPVGTTGEFYGLSFEEKRRIVEITVDETKGRVPIYMGTGAVTTKEVIALNRIAEECRVDAVSVLTPLFISVSRNELCEHYRAIASETSLPVLLYNNLLKTGITIKPETVEKLADIENIVAAKDSSGDFTLTSEYIRRTKEKDFVVLAGRDTLIRACLCHGGAGSIAAARQRRLRHPAHSPRTELWTREVLRLEDGVGHPP